ncbi:MAG: hypothetical protein EB148_02295 [Actinobacteria bacterium]|nr:hypothetical protein [Actinomycetota bacterium]
MSIPSRVLGSGISQLSTVSICGDGTASLAAAGTSAGNATQITYVYNKVSTVASGAGVKLPKAEMGETIIIRNGGANALTVYPYSATDTINAAGFGTINTDCSAMFYAVSNTLWEELQGFGRSVPILHFGSFSDTTLQTAASINTAYGMTFNTTDSSNGVSIGSPTSRLVVANQGVYNVQFSAQLDKTSGGAGNIYIWLRKNGTNVANTATTIAIQGTAARTVAAWNFLIQLEPTNYVELMWATDDTSVRILAASATSVWPAIPSVICTLTQVNNL